MLKIIASLILLWMSGQARGDWASGGGAVLQDAQNPWFLQNTKTVKMCIIWDQNYFHPVDQDVDGLIKRVNGAIQYWKSELANAYVVENFVEVGKQDFVVSEVVIIPEGDHFPPSASCLAADLRIQFGWISQEQVKFFQEKMGGLQQYISAIVRTDYDGLELRGKGFIYLKADSGPYSQSSPGELNQPWGLGAGYLTDYALRHEFGHMFGISHMGANKIMAVNFLEQIFSYDIGYEYANRLSHDGFFSWHIAEDGLIRQFCGKGNMAKWQAFLGITDGDNCIRIYIQNGKVKFESLGGRPRWTLRGEMTMDSDPTYTLSEGIRIYLSVGQKVILDVPPAAGQRPWVLGPMIKRHMVSGNFVGPDGTLKRRVLMTLDPMGLDFSSNQFSAEIDGVWHWNLDKQ